MRGSCSFCYLWSEVANRRFGTCFIGYRAAVLDFYAVLLKSTTLEIALQNSKGREEDHQAVFKLKLKIKRNFAARVCSQLEICYDFL